MFQLEAGKADQREPVSLPQKTVRLDFEPVRPDVVKLVSSEPSIALNFAAPQRSPLADRRHHRHR